MSEKNAQENWGEYGSPKKPLPKWRKEKFPFGLTKSDFPATWYGRADFLRWLATRHKLMAKMYMARRMQIRLQHDERYRAKRNETQRRRGIKKEQDKILKLAQELQDKGFEVDLGAIGLTGGDFE